MDVGKFLVRMTRNPDVEKEATNHSACKTNKQKGMKILNIYFFLGQSFETHFPLRETWGCMSTNFLEA